MNAVTKQLYRSVVYASSTHNVWKDLKERFDKKNISRIYNLLQEISALIKDYYLSKVFLENIQQQRFVQFLSELNESFAQAKGQIMLIIPTPTVNEAYRMVVQDESQRAKTVNVSG
ncbi:uncharacterized protein [Nicotiana sylvestris]|uniref:uncharacterized protein n=1 Tax=Nicotiana sylvestris TaxID=4096 RepID=UPI00388CB3D9